MVRHPYSDDIEDNLRHIAAMRYAQQFEPVEQPYEEPVLELVALEPPPPATLTLPPADGKLWLADCTRFEPTTAPALVIEERRVSPAIAVPASDGELWLATTSSISRPLYPVRLRAGENG